MTDTDRAALAALAPHLVCDDAAAAIDFYVRAFGAEEMMRLATPDGRLAHAALRINGRMVMLVDAFPEHGMRSPKDLGGTPVTIHLMVPDVDAAVARAVEAGAELAVPVADMFWGDRYGVVVDPAGHAWSMATPVRELSPAEIAEAMKAAAC